MILTGALLFCIKERKASLELKGQSIMVRLISKEREVDLYW